MPPATSSVIHRHADRLDWSIHDRLDRWPISEHLFLAAAADEVGDAICDVWTRGTVAWLDIIDAPLIPTADAAFQGLDPIEQVHRTYRPVINSLKSAGVFASERLHNTDHDAWLASHVPNPDGGPPIAADLLRARARADLDDDISYEHWEAAYLDAVERHHLLAGARITVPPVARALAQLAFDGKVTTYARPLGGGQATPLDKSVWAIDDPLPRLASCGLAIDRPFDATAPINHFIFVDRQELKLALPELAATTYVAVTEEFRQARPSMAPELYDRMAGEVTRSLLELMAQANYANWTKPRFLGAMLDRHGSGADGAVFDRAWKDATTRYPTFAKAGRRTGT